MTLKGFPVYKRLASESAASFCFTGICKEVCHLFKTHQPIIIIWYQVNSSDPLLEVNIKMGNTVSQGSRSQNQGSQYLGNPTFPVEIQIMIAEQLCPHCSIEEDAIPATEDARELQRDLGNLAATCRHLYAVANHHRFHSFVMPYDRNFDHRQRSVNDLDGEIDLAAHYNNRALPWLLDQIITYGIQGEHLRYLSIPDFTLQFKAGVTKTRLRRFMATSLNLGITIPSFVPGLLSLPDHIGKEFPADAERSFWMEGQLWIRQIGLGALECSQFDIWMIRLLLFGSTPRLQKLMISPMIARRVFDPQILPTATLPSVTTLGIPRSKEFLMFPNGTPRLQMEVLLRRFPKLRAFQNDDSSLAETPYHRTPADAPPFFPNLRRLVLALALPGRLQHLTQVLREFPQLEELYIQRRPSRRFGDPNFSNANVFNGVHHCLRRLTYTSAKILHWRRTSAAVEGNPRYAINIYCYEERRLSDVPHLAPFAVLEDLTIDQSLLGRTSSIRDRIDSPTGPYFPDLDWKLPQSLRRLTVKFVYDWPQLASQLINLAIAKQRGQFPLLSDIFVVIVRTCTIEYDGVWPPEIPLLPSADVTRDAGELLRSAGISLWTSTADIEHPTDWDRHEEDAGEDLPAGTLIPVKVYRDATLYF